MRLDKEGLTRFHGINERIRVEDYFNVVAFYYRLLSNADYDAKTRIKPTLPGSQEEEEEEEEVYEDFNATLVVDEEEEEELNATMVNVDQPEDEELEEEEEEEEKGIQSIAGS